MEGIVLELQDKLNLCQALVNSTKQTEEDALSEMFRRMPEAFSEETMELPETPVLQTRGEDNPNELAVKPGRESREQAHQHAERFRTLTRGPANTLHHSTRPADASKFSSAGTRLSTVGIALSPLTQTQIREQRLRRFAGTENAATRTAATLPAGSVGDQTSDDPPGRYFNEVDPETRTEPINDADGPILPFKVCADDLPISQLYMDKCTVVCNHEARCCWPCLHTCIKSSLEASVWDHARCLGCREQRTFDEVSFSADVEIFDTYDKLLARRALGQAVDFRWCTAPDCGNGQEHIDG